MSPSVHHRPALSRVPSRPASSRGGLNALGTLCKAYGKAMRDQPDEWPVVRLSTDSYVHSNKAFGKIKIPLLPIVGWEAKEAWTKKQPKKK